jgi:hypothetical protein
VKRPAGRHKDPGDELHYRRLLADLKRLGADESELAGLTTEELANYKRQFVDRLMREARAA